MFKVVIKDIQAIHDAEVVLNDNTITEFVGDNNNGKSVTAKIVQYLTSGDIMHKDVREALIRDGANQGIVLFQWNKKQLALCVAIESRDSYVIYCPNSDEPTKCVKRYFNEKGIDVILEKFGFRVYNKGEVCLQVSPTWGPIPFVTTNGATNYEIVKDIEVDKVAEEFLETFEKITYPVFKNMSKNYKLRIEEKRNALSLIDQYDWAAYGRIAKEIREVYGVISGYTYYMPGHIALCQPVEVVSVNPYVPSRMELFSCPQIIYRPKSIMDTIVNLRKINEGVCPTCGRPLMESSEG